MARGFFLLLRSFQKKGKTTLILGCCVLLKTFTASCKAAPPSQKSYAAALLCDFRTLLSTLKAIHVGVLFVHLISLSACNVYVKRRSHGRKCNNCLFSQKSISMSISQTTESWPGWNWIRKISRQSVRILHHAKKLRTTESSSTKKRTEGFAVRKFYFSVAMLQINLFDQWTEHLFYL